MKLHVLRLAPVLLFTTTLQAAEAGDSSWHATSLVEALQLMVLFTLVGVGLAIAGYKLFDLATPGNLHKEIVENRNVAAAIVGAAVIVGVSIIVAAAIVG